MSLDLSIRWNAETGRYDLVLDADGGPAVDTTLHTAILASVLTWGRARAGDPLPGFDNDLKGHWGDSFARIPGRFVGSRVWLLARRVITPATLRDAKTYMEECLAWLIQDGLASKVDVTVWREGATTIRARAEVTQTDGARLSVPIQLLG